MEGEILDLLGKQTGLFISNLRLHCGLPRMQAALQHFSWENYPLESCSYALSYLYNEELTFTDYTELRMFLARHSQRNDPCGQDETQ